MLQHCLITQYNVDNTLKLYRRLTNRYETFHGSSKAKRVTVGNKKIPTLLVVAQFHEWPMTIAPCRMFFFPLAQGLRYPTYVVAINLEYLDLTHFSYFYYLRPRDCSSASLVLSCRFLSSDVPVSGPPKYTRNTIPFALNTTSLHVAYFECPCHTVTVTPSSFHRFAPTQWISPSFQNRCSKPCQVCQRSYTDIGFTPCF